MLETLEGGSGRFARLNWTDISGSSRLLVTPDFPGTRLSGLCDASAASAELSNIRLADGSTVKLRNRFLNTMMLVTIRDSSGLYHTRTVTEIGTDTITMGSAPVVTESDVSFWAYDAENKHQYVVTAVQLLCATAATYTFRDEGHLALASGSDSQDELGTPGAVGNILHSGSRGGISTNIPFLVTPGDRLYVECDRAAAGSAIVWYEDINSRYFDNVASDPVLTTTTSP